MILEIVAAIVLLSVGVLLGVFAMSLVKAARGPYDGTILVDKREGDGILYTLEIDGDLEQLQYQKTVLLKVAPVGPIRE